MYQVHVHLGAISLQKTVEIIARVGSNGLVGKVMRAFFLFRTLAVTNINRVGRGRRM